MSSAAGVAERNPFWVGLVFGLCAVTGLAAGVQPRLGLEVALGLAFTVAVLANLTTGVILFIVLSFLEVIQFGGAALSFMKIAGLLLFVSWVATSATARNRDTGSLFAAQPALAWASVALISWSAVSLAWAESTGAVVTSTQRYLLDALLLPIVFAAVRRRNQLVWVLAAFVIGAAASAVFGLLQSAGGRVSGTIGDPNEEAAVLVAALVIIPGLIGMMPRGSMYKPWFCLAGFACVAGLLNTGSRGGLVAAAVVLVAAAVFGGRWRTRAAVLLVAGALLAVLYLTVLAPPSAQRVTSGNTSGRADLWRVGWRIFGANPVTGVGSGNFSVSAVHYIQQSGSISRADLIVDVPHVAHNVYLQILDDLGLPGLIAFLAIAAASLGAAAQATRRYEREGDASLELVSRTVAFAILGMLAADVFLSGEYSKQLWLLFALPAPLLALAPSATDQ